MPRKKLFFERIVEITPAWGSKDPTELERFGIHGCNLIMVLKGNKGAVHFVLYTQFHFKHIEDSLLKRGDPQSFLPQPLDLGYHSKKPLYKGQTIMNDSCEYLNGKPCYYDGSGLNAKRIYDVLLEKGSEGVWEELEKYYYETFGWGLKDAKKETV